MNNLLIKILITYIITRTTYFLFDFSLSKDSGVTDFIIDISIFVLVFFLVSKVLDTLSKNRANN